MYQCTGRVIRSKSLMQHGAWRRTWCKRPRSVMIAAFMFSYIRHGRPYTVYAAAAATYETEVQPMIEAIVLMCIGGSEQCFYKTPE